jgi:hypothetical protein
MKKMLILISLLSLLLMGIKFDSAIGRLIRLTIVNKSGLDLEVKLTGDVGENFYYLKIPAGDRKLPAVKVFTIFPDIYEVQPYYIELWDPVYENQCEAPGSMQYYAFRDTRITFLECNFTPREKGENTMVKFTPRWKFIY